MATVTQMKCACSSCLCVISLTEAVLKDGKYYCCDVCADGHPDGSSCCGAPACGCH